LIEFDIILKVGQNNPQGLDRLNGEQKSCSQPQKTNQRERKYASKISIVGATGAIRAGYLPDYQ
jgi:hypothetical protein